MTERKPHVAFGDHEAFLDAIWRSADRLSRIGNLMKEYADLDLTKYMSFCLLDIDAEERQLRRLHQLMVKAKLAREDAEAELESAS